MLLYALLQGAPLLPSKKVVIKTITAFLEPRGGTRIADLGSGDGRVVIALAKNGASVDGFEFNPLLAWWSRRKIRKNGLEARVRILQRNFWNADLSPYDAVTVFGAPHVMARLAKKLRNELKPGAKVCSNAFALPDWTAVKKENGVLLYER